MILIAKYLSGYDCQSPYGYDYLNKITNSLVVFCHFAKRVNLALLNYIADFAKVNCCQSHQIESISLLRSTKLRSPTYLFIHQISMPRIKSFETLKNFAKALSSSRWLGRRDLSLIFA